MSDAETPKLVGFAPVEGERATVLVLGTMPSVRSFELGQYYGHARNAFWDVAAGLGVPRELEYAERCRRLTKLGVALWDVLQECRREGSLDSAIRSPRPNDFDAFFARHPELRAIGLNGRKASALFQRHVTAPDGIELVELPSTSPAHAVRGKLDVWLAGLRPYLE